MLSRGTPNPWRASSIRLSSAERKKLTAALSRAHTKSIVLCPDQDRFYTIEAGFISFYEYQDGAHRLRYRTRRLAVAFDSDSALVLRLGLPEELMAWASRARQELREGGELKSASHIAVAMLPRDHAVSEYNRLLVEHTYGTIFLRKAGLV